jgi:hypothetical protein
VAYVRVTRRNKIKKAVLLALSAAILAAAVVWLIAARASGLQGERPVARENFAMKGGEGVVVVRASRAITAGEAADASKFEVVEVPGELVPQEAVTSMQQLRNMRVASTMDNKELLMQRNLIESSQWYEDSDRLVEHTFQEGAVPSTVEVGSVVDIKLLKSKETDPVVVAKATVVGKMERTLQFYLNAEEQENMKEANTEGLLFLVQYLDKGQAASHMNYRPPFKVSGGSADNPTRNKEGGE